MPLYESHYSNYREELTKLLVEVPCLKNPDLRGDVVQKLSAHIQGNIQRRTGLNDDVSNIVDACSNYDDGLKEFFAILERREGPSKAYKTAFACWQTLRWKVALIELISTNLTADLLNTLYDACRPSTSVTCPTGLAQPDARHIVEALWDARDAMGQRSAIVRLAQQVAAHAPAVRPQLAQWLNEVCACKEIDIDAETVRLAQQPVMSSDEAKPSLLVAVVPDDPNDEQRVTVTLYRWTAQTGASEISGGEAAPQQLHELPAYLFQVVGQMFRECKPQTIELVLPLTLVTRDVGSWLETEMGRALLRRSTLLVRLWERQVHNEWANYAYDIWQTRWQRLQAQGYELPLENLRRLDDVPVDLEALQYELEDSAVTTYGILFAFAPGVHRQKRPLLQRTILNTGMPVALWPHQSDVATQSLLDVVGGCPDKKPLWEHIHELQRQAKPGIGRQLALLWDDPQRELPTFQSFAPL